MGVASGFTYPTDGDTSSSANDLVNNFNILKDSVNNIVGDQITNGTITANKISAILMENVKGDVTTDANLQDAQENFISGCDVYTTSSGAQITVGAGSAMINGQLRRISAAIDTNPGADPLATYWLDVWILADATASTFTVSLVDSGATPGGSSNPGTNGRLIGTVYHIGSGVYGKFTNFRAPNLVYGWSYFTGANDTGVNYSLVYGVTLDYAQTPMVTLSGVKTAAGDPINVAELTANFGTTPSVWARSASTTGCTIRFQDTSNFTSGDFYGFNWCLRGVFS